ncbi:hypothetical protein BYT27DRAFT_7142389 [Phlegmacium glaucopus]|nr:hypothetical protein BYT27DRAFT_7142389 [Phlegmacium glaucopus]
MVSADNLNLDVLELIFAFLSGNDLTSVASVSRSFLAGVIPRLYKTISYRLRQGKGYDAGKTMSPFATLLAHPHLAIHVRSIELRTAPTLKSHLHPIFVRECTQAIQRCKNLKRFHCTVPNILAIFLPSLREKDQLEHVRIHANLTTDQAKMLTNFERLQYLSLEFATWNVVDLLPSWAGVLKTTLTSLTLYMINDLNEVVLESALTSLANLVGLHVVGCPKIDHITVLRMVSHTPLLESLSLTTTENTRPLVFPPAPLRKLKHLALDTRYRSSPSPSPAILTAILANLSSSSPPLTSFTIKLPERKVVVGEPFITQLLEQHSHSLRRLTFLDCGVTQASIAEICKSCLHLERLDVAIIMKEIPLFTKGLSQSKTLQTLVDVDNHVDHGIRIPFTADNAQFIMSQCQSLRKIVTNQRIWTGRSPDDGGFFTVNLERRSSNKYGSLWFIPRE